MGTGEGLEEASLDELGKDVLTQGERWAGV